MNSLEDIKVSEIGQAQKEKEHMFSSFMRLEKIDIDVKCLLDTEKDGG